jgi:2-polyprenyl-3-methyl-5-hydroxy-6-metoxy-1,4-benzoquinol methylase
MKKEHLKNELNFYRQAFSDNAKRRSRKFSWEYIPSKSVVAIVKKNRLAKNAANKKVLDLGCGDGRHIEYFRELGFEVWGVDFSKEAINFCRKRFRGDKKVHLAVADLTRKNILKKFGTFDIVIDWSVLDHIRKEYLKTYIKNISGAIKNSGCGIFCEFDESLSGLFAGRNYKIKRGHYSKAYSISELKSLLKPLVAIDQKTSVLEDEINNYRFNAVLVKKL